MGKQSVTLWTGQTLWDGNPIVIDFCLERQSYESVTMIRDFFMFFITKQDYAHANILLIMLGVSLNLESIPD